MLESEDPQVKALARDLVEEARVGTGLGGPSSQSVCPCPNIKLNRPGVLSVDYYFDGSGLSMDVKWSESVREAVIHKINIYEPGQRKGAATFLWECAERQLKVLGVDKVEGTVIRGNIPATNFWKKMGFTFTEHNLGTHWKIRKALRETA